MKYKVNDIEKQAIRFTKFFYDPFLNEQITDYFVLNGLIIDEDFLYAPIVESEQSIILSNPLFTYFDVELLFIYKSDWSAGYILFKNKEDEIAFKLAWIE